MAQTPPRSFLRDADAFGKESARWRPASGQLAHEVSAAWFGHRAVLALNAAVRRRGITRGQLAEAMGVSEPQLFRQLRGEAPLRLQHIISWSMLLGPQICPPWPTTSDEYFPPEYHRHIRPWTPGGSLALPTIEQHSQKSADSIEWNAVIEEMARHLRAEIRAGTDRYLVSGALLHVVVIPALLEQVEADALQTDQEVLAGTRIDVIAGGIAGSVVVVEHLGKAVETSAVEAQAAQRRVLTAILRVTAGTAAIERVVVLCIHNGAYAVLREQFQLLRDIDRQASTLLSGEHWERCGIEPPDWTRHNQAEVTQLQIRSVLDYSLLLLDVGKSRPIVSSVIARPQRAGA